MKTVPSHRTSQGSAGNLQEAKGRSSALFTAWLDNVAVKHLQRIQEEYKILNLGKHRQLRKDFYSQRTHRCQWARFTLVRSWFETISNPFPTQLAFRTKMALSLIRSIIYYGEKQ